jgi:hypothetical protein
MSDRTIPLSELFYIALVVDGSLVNLLKIHRSSAVRYTDLVCLFPGIRFRVIVDVLIEQCSLLSAHC